MTTSKAKKQSRFSEQRCRRVVVQRKRENNKAASVESSDVHRRPIVIQPTDTMNGMGMRGYSVGLKMGRIDDETACSFREDEVDVKADLYPRSRSYAVRRRNVGFA
ncbi:hypothetical protein ACFX2J_003358 [Malus domestica]|uniref:Uncharacterized protein n=1 Tax=Malus domestica TaxID=3750 RepID=A0A498IVU4_MALDO|nr:hypothetical protein DVH24_034398 [Malus domestica]